MDVFKLTERLMRMDDAAWARHASPFSVWSRFTILPLLALAVWSRVWLGWGALVPVAAVVAWTFVNPRLFRPPERTDNWASQGVRGERLFLARKTHPVPAHHERAVRMLSLLSALGAVVLLWGLWRLDLWATVAGLVLSMGAKAWLVDRMVWLAQDMGDNPLD